MSSFEIGASRPVGAASLNPVTPAAPVAPAADSAATTPAPAGAAEVQTSVSVAAGKVPVDQDRVSQIRKAVENGTYPVIPMRVSDAMIAAGMLLRKSV